MSSPRLTPSLKHLLTLRNPQGPPSPSVHRLNSVFAKTYRNAQEKKAETGWLVLATSTLLTANRPLAVGQLYRFATRSSLLAEHARTKLDVPSAVTKAALMRESALKSVIFVGVPRVIQSLAALHEVLDEEVKSALRVESKRTLTPENVNAVIKRGRGLWDSVYTPHADKLHKKLGNYHPDFIAFIIQAYGGVLAPLPGTPQYFHDNASSDAAAASSSTGPIQGNLSRAMGSVVGMATLRAEGGVGPQLVSHTFGLLKARNDGVEEGMVTEEDRWLASDEGTEWVLRTVDEILEGVEGVDGSKEEGQLQAKL
ncbi:hypothetical protein BKA70DRAFT_1258468 [Coprinopsis sp. MPI-PUGE-AT-0042]|nr:hypothetical protein BKA70DRAFT_1258468 [Coprinopsis sp. MPI-PUGE-AT-0042]